MKQWLGGVLALLCWGSLLPVYAAGQTVTDAAVAAVKVEVRVHQLEGKPAYSYRIHNHSEQSVLGFALGVDGKTGETHLVGDPPLNNVPPANWGSRLLQQQPGGFYELRWQPDFWEHRLKQGQTSDEFTVVVEQANPELAQAYWTVLLSGDQGQVFGRLQSDDAVAPVPKKRKKRRSKKTAK